MIVSRACTEVGRPNSRNTAPSESSSRPLEEFESCAAYVLLGDPGAGKTTSFAAQSEAAGPDAECVSARDFLALNPDRWRHKTLFIDGLDEVRAGKADPRPPFDKIRQRLELLGNPRFRLSCREADWLGEQDRERLAAISPDGDVTVLRLDPLSESDIKKLISDRLDAADATDFIESAHDKGVYGLLGNPQTLTMLAAVVAATGAWPPSRRELFEAACRRMTQEQNKEHLAANRGRPSGPDALLDTAGQLFALMLLSGKAGFVQHGVDAADDFAHFAACGVKPKQARRVLATSLFAAAASAPGRLAPVHRHVAEYLGARYLAQRIKEGVPSRRVLALLTADKQGVATALRGLVAWLAALNQEACADLVALDPAGVSLYGDVSGLSVAHKRALLERLPRQLMRQAPDTADLWDYVRRQASAFTSLVSEDMAGPIGDLLRDPGRDEARQIIVTFVSGVLAYGEPRPELADVLLRTVCDPTWSERVRCVALDAFVHQCTNDAQRVDGLKRVLTRIKAGDLADADEDLRGTILAALYPADISPVETWRCMYERDRESFHFRRWWRFWTDRLVQASSSDQVAEHLDILVTRGEELRPALESHDLQDLPLQLLARGLQECGDALSMSIVRLYDWLDTGLPRHWQAPRRGNWTEAIHGWLAERPDVRCAIVAEGLGRCLAEVDFIRLRWDSRLYGAALPPNLGQLCLDRALAVEDRSLARRLLYEALQTLFNQSGNAGLSLEIVQSRVKGHRLAEALPGLLYCPLDDDYWKDRAEAQTFRAERERSDRKLIDAVRRDETALRKNQGQPRLLHHFADKYWWAVQSGEDPASSFDALLGGNRRLTEAVLAGLRQTPSRADIPDLVQLGRLDARNLRHPLALPVIVGLRERARSRAEHSPALQTSQLEKALVCRYFTGRPDLDAEGGQWYEKLLIDNPQLIADVLMQCAGSDTRGELYAQAVYPLAHDRGHAAVARLVCLPLLEAFPIRCARRRLKDLDTLLWAALQHADHIQLCDLIARKLAHKSMTVAERAHWLCAGFAADPSRWLAPLREHLQDRDQRIRELVGFFCSGESLTFLFRRLDAAAQAFLIEYLGRSSAPDPWPKDDDAMIVSSAHHASEATRRLLDSLAGSSEPDADDMLAGLEDNAALTVWRPSLARIRAARTVALRDALHRYPSIAKILETLAGGPPANAADLAALLVERINDLAKRVRDDNPNGWRQYWNEDQYGHATTQKPEDSCRDALLSALRPYLPSGVDAQPEGQYADGKRADIRVACKGTDKDMEVPIEIKRDSSSDLWRAPRDQLIARYTRAPGAAGYGIYLVFWFGEGRGRDMPLSPDGARPAGPSELKAALEAGLPADSADKISVCVLDVSKPVDGGS